MHTTCQSHKIKTFNHDIFYVCSKNIDTFVVILLIFLKSWKVRDVSLELEILFSRQFSYIGKNQFSILIWIQHHKHHKLSSGSISRPMLKTRMHVSQMRDIMFVLFGKQRVQIHCYLISVILYQRVRLYILFYFVLSDEDNRVYFGGGEPTPGIIIRKKTFFLKLEPPFSQISINLSWTHTFVNFIRV